MIKTKYDYVKKNEAKIRKDMEKLSYEKFIEKYGKIPSGKMLFKYVEKQKHHWKECIDDAIKLILLNKTYKELATELNISDSNAHSMLCGVYRPLSVPVVQSKYGIKLHLLMPNTVEVKVSTTEKEVVEVPEFETFSDMLRDDIIKIISNMVKGVKVKDRNININKLLKLSVIKDSGITFKLYENKNYFVKTMMGISDSFHYYEYDTIFNNLLTTRVTEGCKTILDVLFENCRSNMIMEEGIDNFIIEKEGVTTILVISCDRNKTDSILL